MSLFCRIKLNLFFCLFSLFDITPKIAISCTRVMAIFVFGGIETTLKWKILLHSNYGFLHSSFFSSVYFLIKVVCMSSFLRRFVIAPASSDGSCVAVYAM